MTSPRPPHRLAALSAALTPSSASCVLLIPAGPFRAKDGRPAEVAQWELLPATAAALCARFAAQGTDMVVDYEHQTLAAQSNGQPAPASGWITALHWDAAGLWGEVTWTAAARAAIDADAYRYLSPVMTYSSDTGHITGLLHVALTNSPALDCLPAVTAALTALALTHPTESPITMPDDLLEQLRWMLDMPVGTTAAEMSAQLKKLIAQLSPDQGMAAASINLPALIQSQADRIAALTAAQSSHVPLAALQEVQGKLVALTAKVNKDKANDIIQSALADGRLLPNLSAWAADLASTNLSALTAYLDTAQPIAALTGPQTAALGCGSGKHKSALTATQVAVCASLGIDESDYAAALED